MSRDPLHSLMLMMVAQKPFSPKGDTFCKLVPVAFLEEPLAPIDSDDFRNDGEIWWMLTDRTAALAEPGRLVTGFLEKAKGYEDDKPDSSEFEAKRDSVRDPRHEEAMTIVPIEPDSLKEFSDIVAPDFRVRLTYPPTSSVFVKWRGSCYGPLRISSSPRVGRCVGQIDALHLASPR